MTDRVRAGALSELQRDGRLLAKVGSVPVLVLWHEDRPFAIEDRCPHLGFPLHRGTVEAGLLTCHWHHARSDLTSGCTLDPWADDARGFDVAIDGDGDGVWLTERADGDPLARLQSRLRDGLEQGLDLVIAKAVIGLLEGGVPASSIVSTGLEFGATYREAGWGAGLTVLVAMANLLPHIAPADRAPALIHALVFVSNDTRGRPPRFGEAPLTTKDLDAERLAFWYRRFVETRSPDAAERSLATAIASAPQDVVEAAMFAAATDHVFLDEGHTLDFTNKAFEALALVGDDAAALVLPSLVAQTCRADRAEESSAWRHPHDLAALVRDRTGDVVDALAAARGKRIGDDEVRALAWDLLAEEPGPVLDALVKRAEAGATAEELARAIAFAAALRLVRFHVQNDVADWNTVHHAFTTANAVHQASQRKPTSELARGLVHLALRVHLDRFLNVPPARLPGASGVDAGADLSGAGGLEQLRAVWDVQGGVDRAGAAVWSHLSAGGSRDAVIAELAHALLAEDAGFHWYQVVEAGVRQSLAWPEGSDESALVLVGVARFLAAHTPTIRQLPTLIRTAARLRRGEPVYEAEAEA